MELHEVNNLGFDEFTSIFGNIIEHCPVIAAGVWSKSPFQDFKDIQEGFGWTIDNLPLNGINLQFVKRQLATTRTEPRNAYSFENVLPGISVIWPWAIYR